MTNEERKQMAHEALEGLGVQRTVLGATPFPKIEEDASEKNKQAALDNYVGDLLAKPNAALTSDETSFLRDGLKTWVKDDLLK